MIFILGIERSATTWIANILDHHSKMDVFMEPLSKFNSCFKQWPGRFEKLENYEEAAAYFKKEFETLTKHRRFLFTRFSDSARSWQTDLRWAQFLVQKQLAPDAVNDFFELNFHRQDRQVAVTKAPPLEVVIKELRLNFKAGILSCLGNQPRVLISLREMASNVRSILQQIEKGDLAELKSDLMSRYGNINPQTVCTYWFESYKTLFELLQKLEVDYKIISHTTLLQTPVETVNEMFGFLDLEMTSSVHAYLKHSDQRGDGKHSTERNRKELLEHMQNDREHIYPEVERQLNEIYNHAVLKNFVNKA